MSKTFHIETSRLILRTAVKPDAAFMELIRSDPADLEMQVFDKGGVPAAELEVMIEKWAEQTKIGKAGQMVIVLKPTAPGFDAVDAPTSEDGKTIGTCGWNGFRYAPDQHEPSVWKGSAIDWCNIGIHLLPSVRQKGLGKKAYVKLIDKSFELGTKVLSMDTMVVNTQFQEWAKRLGIDEFKVLENTRFGHEAVYTFDKPSWEKVKSGWAQGSSGKTD